MPGIEIDIVEDHHQLSDHIVDLYRRLDLRCDQNFNRDGVIQNWVELVELFLFVFVYLLFVCDLLVLDCLRLLPFFFRQLLPKFPFFHFQLVLLSFTFFMNLDPFHLIFDIMGLHFDTLIELCNALRLVNYSLGLVFSLFRLLLL